MLCRHCVKQAGWMCDQYILCVRACMRVCVGVRETRTELISSRISTPCPLHGVTSGQPDGQRRGRLCGQYNCCLQSPLLLGLSKSNQWASQAWRQETWLGWLQTSALHSTQSTISQTGPVVIWDRPVWLATLRHKHSSFQVCASF